MKFHEQVWYYVTDIIPYEIVWIRNLFMLNPDIIYDARHVCDAFKGWRDAFYGKLHLTSCDL